MAGIENSSEANHQNERAKMLKAFDATESGVKGLVDSGLRKIPEIFVRAPDELAEELTYGTSDEAEVPIVDLTGIHDVPERRKKIVEEVGKAAETWGFFHVVNHGIPERVIEEMMEGVKEFNEMEGDEKRKYYSRDPTRNVKFSSNYDLFASRTANWRDTLSFSFAQEFPTHQLPPPCRVSALEYSKHVATLASSLLELLSEGLGLEPNYLNKMISTKEHSVACHYYPACPQPELAVGIVPHTDIGFLTLLLQNQIISSLQFLYQDQWVNVTPIPGALLVNIADLLQLVSNGRLKSRKHRVVANSNGPRISVASFFAGPFNTEVATTYGPIKDLLSHENPPKYRDVVFTEFMHEFITNGLDQYPGLDYYKL